MERPTMPPEVQARIRKSSEWDGCWGHHERGDHNNHLCLLWHKDAQLCDWIGWRATHYRRF